MYEAYWGLKEKPFQNTPDPRFLYHSQQHEEALSRLIYAIQERVGGALLTGVFGCGKTLLGYTLMKELSQEKYKVAFLTNPQMSYLELLLLITQELGGGGLPTKKTEVLTNVIYLTLKDILNKNFKEGKETVIVVDEAHIIQDAEVFEGLRLLLNFQLEDRFLLTLVLMGQPELRTKVDELRQLEQRISTKCHLDNLDEKETAEYVSHRYKVAGGVESPFSASALKLIYDYSGGIPRRVNRLCDLCLLNGFGRKTKTIDKEIIQEEVASLGTPK
ncbi:MAG: AAA family ATPase [Candidatus Omnitrophica bacterium]|nr:AAA family ATPase [Candidatus Omnitrophota bacterium]